MTYIDRYDHTVYGIRDLFQYKDNFSRYRDNVIRIKHIWECRVSIIGIHILVIRHIHIDQALSCIWLSYPFILNWCHSSHSRILIYYHPIQNYIVCNIIITTYDICYINIGWSISITTNCRECESRTLSRYYFESKRWNTCAHDETHVR